MAPSAPHDRPSVVDERVAHAIAQRQFWQAMADRIHQDRRNLRFVVPVTAVLAVVAGLVVRSTAWGGAMAALGLSIWGMGQYFVRVRAHEYAFNLAEADRELQRVQAEQRAQHGAGPSVASPRPGDAATFPAP